MVERMNVNIGKSTTPTSMIFLLVFAICIHSTSSWIHHLNLLNDDRRHIAFTTSFGFLQGGTLDVNITLFQYHSQAQNESDVFGFSLDKSRSSSVLTTMTNSPSCHWGDPGKSVQSVNFRFDIPKQRIMINRIGDEIQNLTVSSMARDRYLLENGLAHGRVASSIGKEDQADTKTESKPQSTQEKDKPTEESKGSQKVVEVTSKDGKVATTTAPPKADKVTSKQPDAGESATTPSKAKKPQTIDHRRKKRWSSHHDAEKALEVTMESTEFLPLTKEVGDAGVFYKAHFIVHVKTEPEEGLYSLFFHNCLQHPYPSPINLTLEIYQDNNGNYLSADEMPLPAMYIILCVVYLVLTFSWLSVLRKADEGVYKLHWLMLVVVFFKMLSCFFHGVNLFMISHTGIHLDAWAILWYIVYLMRGALMFLTILLIGTGWVFIKHVFTERERKLFLVVIPLQILDNVAWVIMEESEEGKPDYDTWHKIFIGFDLICCFTILFPVIWSIRHLQEASKTDGKAAMNLQKLKLFRHYYFMVVCYIYFTRIIKYFLEITLPFHYGWLGSVLTESFLLVFYVLIAYKFRPKSDNPYLQVPMEDDEDIQMDEVLTKTGNTDTVTRVNQGRNEEKEEEGEEVLFTRVKQRESSHEYD